DGAFDAGHGRSRSAEARGVEDQHVAAARMIDGGDWVLLSIRPDQGPAHLQDLDARVALAVDDQRGPREGTVHDLALRDRRAYGQPLERAALFDEIVAVDPGDRVLAGGGEPRRLGAEAQRAN